MAAYLLKRCLLTLPVCFGVVVIVSLMIHLVPGDPVDLILGEYATLTDKSELRMKLGLDLPVMAQIWRYLSHLFSGDLGQSLLLHRPVGDLIRERVPTTLSLAAISLTIAMLLGIALGITAALNHGKKWDQAAMLLALVSVAIPNFWLGPMLVLLFSLRLDWLPVSGSDSLLHFVLPALTIGTSLAAIVARMTRNSMLEQLNEEYVQALTARGLRRKDIILKHVLRNAGLPLVTVIGLQFGVLLTGAVVTERIFDLPGLGTLILDALGNRDYPLVQGCVLIFSLTYLLVNLLTDVVYRWVDPRVEY